MSYFSSSKTHFSTLSINFHIISLIPLFILHYFLSKYYEIIFYFFIFFPTLLQPHTPAIHTQTPHPTQATHSPCQQPTTTNNKSLKPTATTGPPHKIYTNPWSLAPSTTTRSHSRQPKPTLTTYTHNSSTNPQPLFKLKFNSYTQIHHT